MKKLYFLFAILLVGTLAFSQTGKTYWTQKDRQFLLDGLKNTQLELLNEVKGLNSKQVHFKPDSTKWSIAEILEHLGVFEELLLWDLFSNQYTPVHPELVDSVKGKDSIMLAYATDPSKGQSHAAALPLGRFKELPDLLNYFNFYRAEVTKFIETTNVDFRVHFIYRPPDWGNSALRDLHQYAIIYISHTTRHTNQIRRNKADVNFPR